MVYALFRAAKSFIFFIHPIKNLSPQIQEILLYGSGKEEIEYKVEGKKSSFKSKKPFEGLVPMIERRYQQTTSDGAKSYYEQFMVAETCPTCKGKRLKEEVLFIQIQNNSIIDLTQKNLQALLDFFNNIELNSIQTKIADKLLKEISTRLQFLLDVGLDYLSLSRKSNSSRG